ncbi:MAG TPA: DUF4412 domain-containing protein [Thermoanaerobaculia bacterium]
MRPLVLCAAVTLIATNLLAGHTYHFQSVTSQPRGEVSTAGTAVVDGGNVRVDFEKGDNMLFSDKSVVISKDGGKNLVVIDTAGKDYYEIKLDDILNIANVMARSRGGASFQISYANPTVTVKDEGDGGQVEGFATHKYGIDSSYDANVNMMGRAMSNHVEMRSELWVTDELPAELTTFVQWRGFRMGIPELDELLDSQSRLIKGFPLREVMTSTTTSSRGGSRTWTTTTTISNVKKNALPASEFDVPAGYTKTEMPQRPSWRSAP